MSTNPRRQRHLKKKIIAYISLLVILIASIFLINLYFNIGKPLFVSPLGKINANVPLVEKTLRENKIAFSTVVLDNNSYLIEIQNNGRIRLDRNKDINKQISSLQKILIQLTIEGKSFKNIDFRFIEPVVSF